MSPHSNPHINPPGWLSCVTCSLGYDEVISISKYTLVSFKGEANMDGSANKLYVVNRKGCPIHYWLAGQTDKPLIVFTHGATMDHHMFDAQVNILVQKYRVLTWDVRGQGESQPTGEGFSIAGSVEDLLSFIDELGYKEAVFVGQSMGGYIAQELVFRYPKRVRALVIIGSTCITLKLSIGETAAIKLSPAIFHLYPEKVLKRQIAKASAVKPEVQAYVYDATSKVAKGDFISIWIELVRCLHYEAQYKITCPLLLTHGEHDRTGNIKKIAPIWAARDLQCQYTVIPNAGHCANQDNPEFFNSVLTDFLNSLPYQLG